MRDDCGIMFRGEWHVVWGGLYIEASKRFLRPALPRISRAIKAEFHDAGVVVRVSKEKYEAIQNYFLEQGQKRKDNQSEL